MVINKLIFERGMYEVKFFAPHGKKKFELGTIVPTIHKEFVINCEHFEPRFNDGFKTIEQAQKIAQHLFERWVQDFSVNEYKNEYIVE